LQPGFELAQWTRVILREVIRNQFALRLSEVSVGRLLCRLGLSPQRPLRKTYERAGEKLATKKRARRPAVFTSFGWSCQGAIRRMRRKPL